MASPVVYLSVSNHQGCDSNSLFDDCDEDETPESRDYANAMRDVNVKKPKGFGRRTIIVTSLVLLLLAAVAVGISLLIVHWVRKISVDVPATVTPTTTRSMHVSSSGSWATPFVVTSSRLMTSSQTKVSPTLKSSSGVLTPSMFGVCWNGDSDCPDCPAGKSESFTSYIRLGLVHDIVESVNRSQHIMRSIDNKDVILYRPLLILNTTLNYFCCHTSEEKVKILEVLGNQTWTPFNITYDTPSCDLDHNGVTIYMLALLSNSSQDFLFNFVREIESSMRARGVPVNTPRKQQFHVTLSLVNHSFPVHDVIDLIHRDIPVFGSLLFDRFYSELHEFKSSKFK